MSAQPRRRVVVEPRIVEPIPVPPTASVPTCLPIVYEGKKEKLIAPAGLKREDTELIRLGALNERVTEVVRAIVFELGDPSLIEAAEAALKARGLTGKARRGTRPRRQTVYLEEKIGAIVYALAKEAQLSPSRYIERTVTSHVESLDSK